MQVIGYIRVSTTDQAESGLGMDAQRSTIEQACQVRGWQLVHIYEDTASGKAMRGRDGLGDALACLEEPGCPGDALVVSRIDRLSRSAQDFANLAARAKAEGWGLCVVDLGLDTTTPHGRLVLGVMAQFAEFEREIISTRTREALAVARAKGVRLGGPRLIPVEIESRIVAERRRGRSLAAIATSLNDDGVPTTNGGRCWYAATVRRVVQRADS